MSRRPHLVDWEPVAAPGIRLPMRFRPHVLKDFAVGAVMTVVLAVAAGVFVAPVAALAMVGIGLAGFAWIGYSGIVERLSVCEGELVRRRWWGAVERTPFTEIATIVYLPEYGEHNQSGTVHYPFLVLLDDQGRRLHRLTLVDWTLEQLTTTAAIIPARKLIAPSFVDRRGLRELAVRYPGIRR